MVENMKIENDPSINLNTPEAKAARDIAVQFIAKRRGKVLKTQSIRKEVDIMVTLVDELEKQQGNNLLNFIQTITFTEENGFTRFSGICDKTLESGISWGRIVSIHLFAALLAEKLQKNGQENLSEKVSLWLGICVAKRASWIKNEGLGWDGFVRSLHGNKELENNIFKGLFNVTLGLGTVAAALFIQAK